MTRQAQDTAVEQVLELLTDHGFEGIARGMEILLNEAMRLERSEALQASPYQRTEKRRGYANGFKPKRWSTRLGELDVQVPQVRSRNGEPIAFYPRSLEKGARSERALKLAIAEMYVQGVSTRRVTAITRELCGLDVSSAQVSRATKLLDEELSTWRTRPLGETPYLVLDARYEKVRHGGAVVSCAVLVAVGVQLDGHRTVLGVSVSLSEAEVHWRDFLASLQDRGLHGVRYVVSDNHAGLKAALAARMPGIAWQRCQVHLQRDAGHHVPKVDMRPAVAQDLREVFHASDRVEAEHKLKQVVVKYRKRAPKLASWMEESIPEGLAVLALPAAHRRHLKSTNMLENLNKQIKRRTAVAGLFPNEGALMRLVTAILVEQSEEWETGRIYLRMENR